MRRFVGAYEPQHYLLDASCPVAVGPYSVSSYYMEAKRQQAQAMADAKARILAVAREYEALSGRSYAFFEEYRMEDAEQAMILMGSAAGTAKDTVDLLRKEGRKVGLIKLRVFRPFPGEELARALAGVSALAILDRADSFSACGGPLTAEVCAARLKAKLTPDVIPFVYGLGGRDVRIEDVKQVFEELICGTGDGNGLSYRYLGVRE